MDNYYRLIAQRKIVNNSIRKEKRRLHSSLTTVHKKIFIALDILFILSILFNFGAITITNAMVVKSAPSPGDITFIEANPVVAEAYDLKTTPEANNLFKKMLIHFSIWFLLLGCYVYLRRTIFTEAGLTVLSTIVLGYFIIYGWDFFNDFGYWIGRVMFG